MKKLLLSILAVVATNASASTVILSSNNNGPSVFNHANTALVPNGNLIRVGFFTNPADVSTFQEFGTSTIKNGAPVGGKPGKVTGSVTNSGNAQNPESEDALFNGKDIYVWIYNAATAAGATESGIFKAVGFTFAVDDPASASDSVTVDSTKFTEYLANSALAEQGRYDAGTANLDGTGTGRLILGLAIPEPSSMGLLALAGLALARRRR